MRVKIRTKINMADLLWGVACAMAIAMVPLFLVHRGQSEMVLAAGGDELLFVAGGPLPPVAVPQSAAVAVRRKRILWRDESGMLMPVAGKLEYRSATATARLRLVRKRALPDGYLLIGFGSGERLELRPADPADFSRLAGIRAVEREYAVHAGEAPTEWRIYLR